MTIRAVNAEVDSCARIAPKNSGVKTRLYWPELDGLRFFAALLVFLYHAPVLPIAGFAAISAFGWCGVDLFLTLSAFLLARLLQEEYSRTGGIDIRAFYVRRILRIWPLFIGFTTAMLLVQVVRNVGSLREGAGFWLSHLTFINNLVISSGGFERRLEFTSHLWTISLEEQFYAILPLVMVYLCRAKIAALQIARLAAVCIVILGGMRLACVLIGMPHPFIWVLPIRADSFVLGLAFGLGAFFPARSRGIPAIHFVIGLGLLVVAGIVMPSLEEVGWKQVIGYTVVASSCVFLINGTMHCRAVRAFFSFKPFAYLGKISFGIYVFHMLAIAMGKIVGRWLGANNPFVVFGIALVLTLGMAAVSYQLFERWFLRFKKRSTLVESRPI